MPLGLRDLVLNGLICKVAPPTAAVVVGRQELLFDELVQPVKVDVGQDRAGHAPNAMGNFCFEVTLGYQRLERLPRPGSRGRHDG
jgi:RNase P/RNase MRP subunit p29